MSYTVVLLEKRRKSRKGMALILLSIILVTAFGLNFDLSYASTPGSHRVLQSGVKTGGVGPIFVVAIIRTQYPNQSALVNLYKPYIRSSDYVLTKPSARNLDYGFQLPGLKGVEYFSLAQIQANAGSLKAKGVNFISYDIEAQYSPANEVTNPVQAVRNASNIVHSNGLEFMLSTTRNMDIQYASQFAPLVDIYNPQGQVLEPDPFQYSSFYRNITSQIRGASPTVKIVAELSTIKGSIENMEQAFSLVAPYVDGVTFWYGTTPDQLLIAKQFLDWLRLRY